MIGGLGGGGQFEKAEEEREERERVREGGRESREGALFRRVAANHG